MSGIDNFNAGETPHAVIIAGSMDAAGTVTPGAPGAGTSPNTVQGTTASGATATGNPVQTGGVANTTTPTAVATGQAVSQWMGDRGSAAMFLTNQSGANPVSVALSGAAGVANTAAGLLTYARANRFNGSTWDQDRKPSLASRIVSSAATTNATVAKASAGDVFKIYGQNTKATVVYLKIYNKATAPTVGTDIPVLTLPITATSVFNVSLDAIYFSAGIAYAFTTGSADSDTTALAAGDIVGFNLIYA